MTENERAKLIEIRNDMRISAEKASEALCRALGACRYAENKALCAYNALTEVLIDSVTSHTNGPQ